MFYCFQNEILLPGTQSFSIFGSGQVGYMKKVQDGLGTRIPSGPDQGSTNCYTPPSRMGEYGVSWELYLVYLVYLTYLMCLIYVVYLKYLIRYTRYTRYKIQLHI